MTNDYTKIKKHLQSAFATVASTSSSLPLSPSTALLKSLRSHYTYLRDTVKVAQCSTRLVEIGGEPIEDANEFVQNAYLHAELSDLAKRLPALPPSSSCPLLAEMRLDHDVRPQLNERLAQFRREDRSTFEDQYALALTLMMSCEAEVRHTRHPAANSDAVSNSTNTTGASRKHCRCTLSSQGGRRRFKGVDQGRGWEALPRPPYRGACADERGVEKARG